MIQPASALRLFTPHTPHYYLSTCRLHKMIMTKSTIFYESKNFKEGIYQQNFKDLALDIYLNFLTFQF